MPSSTSSTPDPAQPAIPWLRRLAVLPLLLLFIGLMALTPRITRAQGFGVYEQGTCTMGRGGATVAMPCNDASTVFYNPAGLAGAPGLTVSGGATLIIAQGSFTKDYTLDETDLANDPIPVPHLYLRYGINERWAAGLGVNVPYGLATEWPTANFDGRFVGYDNALQSIYIQPTFAYRVSDRIAIGGGLDVVIGSVTLNQHLDLSQQVAQPGNDPVYFGELGIPFHTQFADASLEANGATGIGGNIGLTVEATDRLHFGARFLTPVKLDYEGTATFEPLPTGIVLPAQNPFDVPAGTPLDALVAGQFQSGGPLTEQAVTTEITMPAQLVVGLSYQATARLLLLADYQFTGWSAFDEIVLNFEKLGTQVREENFENTSGVHVGAEYAATEAWTLRAGYFYNEAAAPDAVVTPLLPEADRNQFTVGLGWQPSPTFEVNVAYQYLHQGDRRGRVRDERVGETLSAALNNGLYSFNAHLIGTTLTLHF